MSSDTEQRAVSLVNSFTNLNRVAADGVRSIVSGAGVFVRDSQGQEYLDAISGLWSTSLGFSEPELVAAAAEQLHRLPSYHIAIDRASDVALQLCDRLAQAGPGKVARVLLTNSGSEANDTQVKLLRYYWHWKGEPGRTTFIARERAFHGSTLGAASLSDLGPSGAAFGLPLLDVRRISAPCRAWNALPGETDAEFTARLAAELENVITDAGPDTIAGIFLEPVMGAAGVVVPPEGYYAALQAVTERYGVRLVADEVICGFGRVGTMWGCDALGIEPSATSCAKGLAGGYMPAGAVLVDAEIAQALLGQSSRLGTFAHGFTTGGHPVAAAVALRTLELLEERDIVANAARCGALMQQRLREAAELPVVSDVRSIGLLAGVELGGPAARDLVQKAVGIAAAHGLLVRGAGTTLCLCPPLVISEDEVALMTGRLLAALSELAAPVPG
jgi:4-aminobutyrate---pyruvate transaminase